MSNRESDGEGYAENTPQDCETVEDLPDCDMLHVKCRAKLSGGLERYECSWSETFELQNGDVSLDDEGNVDFSDEFHERTGMFKCGWCRNNRLWYFNGVEVSPP